MSIEALGSMIERYAPVCEQEEKDRELMLAMLRGGAHLLTRENEIAHFTASAWVAGRNLDKVLLAYHNIYSQWAWLGGHADGDSDLLSVALREAVEETGARVRPLSVLPQSLEIIGVNGHFRHGLYVPSHLHLNISFLLIADENDEIRVKPDENSGVSWFSLQDAENASPEPFFRAVYGKLNNRLAAAGSGLNDNIQR